MKHTLKQVSATKNAFSIQDNRRFKEKAFAWAANAFDVFCYLDNNNYTEGYLPPEFDALIGVGCRRELTLTAENGAFEALRAFQSVSRNWLFGFLSYDLKNAVENLQSDNFDGHQMPVLHFFEPQIVLKISEKNVEITVFDPDLSTKMDETDIFEAILDATPRPAQTLPNAALQPRIAKGDYLDTVRRIQAHILRGDIFEMIFCQEFFAENADIDPFALFQNLNKVAQAPFSAFYKNRQHYVISASPERFLKKKGQKLISQPIKGTARRGNNATEDAQIKAQLQSDPKNRSENVMIVDLVRNDLGKICAAGTVRVPELFGVYSFPTVHQMISTVEGDLQADKDGIDALKATFPMGSMTGAPKVRAMQLIEHFERSKRGAYSGALGYFSPEGDFDFNVLIRSILYNAKNCYLSFQVGGAIIANGTPEDEYAECLLKAAALMRALGHEPEPLPREAAKN